MQTLGSSSRPGTLGPCVVFALLASAAPARGQAPIASSDGANDNIFGSDLAVLEAGDDRKDLPCTVVQLKPTLGFDLDDLDKPRQ